MMSTTVQTFQLMQAHGHCTRIIMSFGGTHYCLDPAAAQRISFQPSRPSIGLCDSLKEELHACTVIDRFKDHFNQEDLAAISFDLARYDDVWSPPFLEGEAGCCYKTATEIYLQYDTLQQSSYFKRPNLPNYALREMGPTFF